MRGARATRRTDAVRNTERIIEAAVLQLRQRPDATMTSIARAAGVGRVTLYGHFGSRRDLVDAAIVRELADTQRDLDALGGIDDSEHALAQVLGRSWLLMDQSRALVTAAREELSPDRLWELHQVSAARVMKLIRRGQGEGVFRTDLPMWWLIAVIHQVFHAVPTDFAFGRRADPSRMPEIMIESVLALLRAPKSQEKEVLECSGR